MTDPDKIRIAQQAVYHALNRIRTDQHAKRVFGVGTEAFSLLTAAASALSGEPINQVREYVCPGSSDIHRSTPEEILEKT